MSCQYEHHKLLFSSFSPAAIEACLGHLLKRRAAGFLRSDKIAALFTKVGKVYDTAGEICRKVQEQLQQQADLTRLVTVFPLPIQNESNTEQDRALLICIFWFNSSFTDWGVHRGTYLIPQSEFNLCKWSESAVLI